MKIIISTLLLISFGCMGQYPLQKAYKTKSGWWIDTTKFYVDTVLIKSEPDTIPVILLVSDTQPINGKTDTHVYWVKGYKVVEDFDTYYLDISKKRFGRSVIIWLDQNL